MKIKIGKYVNTHGIKGEIRLISNFTRKDLVFVPNYKIYIDNKEFIIIKYRTHKGYDMLTLNGINNINEIEYLKGNDVYIDEINDTFIDENLINYKISINNEEYKIKDIIDNYMQKLIVLENDKKIPYADDYIIKKDIKNKIIYMNVPDNLL